MQIRSIRPALAVVAALAAAGLCNGVQAQAVPGLDSLHFKDWLASRQNKPRPQQETAGVADRTPATLISIHAEDSVDVGVQGAVIAVSFKASDDVYGVRYASALVTGPSLQRFVMSFGQAAPSKHLAGKMYSENLSPFLQPGVYALTEAYVEDSAGNVKYYGVPELEKMGKSTFEVKNDRGYDVAPPSLASGTIETPKMSLAALHPGTSDPAFVRMKVKAFDAGTWVVAGVKSATAEFCRLSHGGCIYLASSATDMRPMVAEGEMLLAGQVFDKTTPPGEYHLRSISMTDFAGNTQGYFSREFGGSTNFDTYFPSKTIKLVP